MLDAGQVICHYDVHGGRPELVFTAKITPSEIRELLPLASHPVPHSILRYFLEGLVNIVAEDRGTDALVFSRTERFLQLPKHAPGGAIYQSGVEVPDWLGLAMMRAVSEKAVAEAIGFPVVPSADGWIYPRIGYQTVGVKPLHSSNDLVSFPTITDFQDDIIVVTFPTAATQTAHLIGWLDIETFRREHGRQQRDGSQCCVFRQEKLFPMASLIELAKTTPHLRAQ
jgi:hypothetical protein